MRFRHSKKVFHLIDFEKPNNKDYIILESLNQVKEGINYKSIHIITLEINQQITIGRAEADVIIKDISVSRKHGVICYTNNNKITLKDSGSKFGTLILLQEEFVINTDRVSLQIGRTFLDIKSLPIYSYIEYEKRRIKLIGNQYQNK